MVYDLGRCLHRLGGRVWRELLDTMIMLSAAVTLFLFVMAGGGELRIFILLGMVIGGTVYFGVLSRPMRPLWLFWQTVLLLPLRLLGTAGEKFLRAGEKLFSFWKKWCKMKALCKRKGERKRWRKKEGGNPSGG